MLSETSNPRVVARRFVWRSTSPPHAKGCQTQRVRFRGSCGRRSFREHARCERTSRLILFGSKPWVRPRLTIPVAAEFDCMT